MVLFGGTDARYGHYESPTENTSVDEGWLQEVSETARAAPG